MPSAELNLKVEEGASFGLKLRVIKSDRTLKDLTNLTPRTMCRIHPDDNDKIWNHVEDGKHLINGLTDGEIEFRMTAEETDALNEGAETNLTSPNYDLELVECEETQIVDSGSGGQSIAFSGVGVTASVALGAAPTAGDIHRIKNSENSGENDGSYVVAASPSPTTTAWSYTRAVVTNAADTTCDIHRLDLNEENVVRLCGGRVDFSREYTR